MVIGEKYYIVLVVSAAEKFHETMTALLPATDYYPVKFVTNIAAAKRAFLEQRYDFVIINAPVHDDFGTRFAIDVCSNADTVAMILAHTDVYPEIYTKVVTEGVFTLAKPTSAQMISQALKWMAAARERMRRLEKKTTSIEEKMEEIRLVNRAKWLLIENLRMSESDAHRYIEKQAMNRCVNRRDIALSIIKTYS